MAHILILGGGFGGVVAAERLAKTLGSEHEITLVSRNNRFVFYPALVRLAFGKCQLDDVSFDLRGAMLDRRVRFVEGEVARINPYARTVTLASRDLAGEMSYDYLVFALGRRLATERVPGFFEHANHLLTVAAALKFGQAVRQFHKGNAIIGYCPDARLDVPAYETAFALARRLEEKGEGDQVKITLACSDLLDEHPGGSGVAGALRDALEVHKIDVVEDFPIYCVTASEVKAGDGQQTMPYDLLMLIPPFAGAGAVAQSSIVDSSGFVRVDPLMRVNDVERMYAIGDCTDFPGPKMGHVAVLQAEVAAANILAEVEGRQPQTEYQHELKYVIDEGGPNSIYLHKPTNGEINLKHGYFWSWAKRIRQMHLLGRWD